MLPAIRVNRRSNTAKELEERHIEEAWATIHEARRMLADHPCPDTFLGRKTQEPFPDNNDR
jgi:hypothetical protein